jgi:hypothetical protein
MSNNEDLPFLYIGAIISLAVIYYVMTFFKYEVMRSLNQKLLIQEEQK